MVAGFVVIAFLALIVMLAFRSRRGVVGAALLSVALAVPVWFVFEVAYPPGCPTPDSASAGQRAAGEVCSEMQMRLHGLD